MSNKQQTEVKLYTGQQLVNTIDAIRDYLKNYPEKFHESMIEKHLNNLTPIEFPSYDDIKDESMKHYDINGADYYFELGAKWMRDKIQGGEQ